VANLRFGILLRNLCLIPVKKQQLYQYTSFRPALRMYLAQTLYSMSNDIKNQWKSYHLSLVRPDFM
jgi:hypothetical protein